MPYRDEEKRKRMRRIFFDSAHFADTQIRTMKEMGIRHTAEEWKEIRRQLIKSKLSDRTIEALHIDATHIPED